MTATIRKCPSKPELQSCGIVADGGVRSNHESSVAKRCRQILEFYEAQAGKSDHESARWLVEQLSQDEQEVAARCSYAYWYLSRLPQEQHASSLESARFASAMREAIRHENCADDREEVLKLLKTTLDFHKTHKSTLYRTCMFESEDGRCSDSIDDMFLSQQRRERIHEEMLNFQTHVVRGRDKEDRAIFFAFPRKAAGKPDQEQLFVDAILYTMERALACSEFRSIGRQDELFCVVDCKGGSCPPFKTLQAGVSVMQKFYPGRLKRLVVLNAPYLITATFKMIKPFLDPVTAQKFAFPSSKAKAAGKDSCLISSLIDESQAMPALMPGRGKLSPTVDAERFLYEVPFHELYDCELPGGVEHPILNKPSSPAYMRSESQSTSSLSVTESYTESSSIDSGRTNNSKSRMSLGGIRFRSSKHKQNRRSKNKVVKVSVRSLAIGKLALEEDGASEQPPALKRFPLYGRSPNVMD